MRAVYAKINAVTAKGDAKKAVALVARYTTPDFVSTMGDQRVGREKYLVDMKQGLSVKNPPRVTANIVSLQRVGKTFVLAVAWTIKTASSDGKPTTMALRTTDTWVPTPNGYRMKSSAHKM